MTRVVAFYLALGLTLSLTGGCAFGVRHAVITYPPEPRTAKTATNDPPAGMNRRIAVLPFADERKNKQNVGYVLNGFGMRTASVVCDNPDLSQVVTDAVRTALKNTGYEVVNVSAPVTADVTTLCGSMTRVYCDAYYTYDATVTLTVQFKRGDRSFYQEAYQGKGGVGMNWGATGESYGRSLSLALADAIEQLQRKLPSALNQYHEP